MKRWYTPMRLSSWESPEDIIANKKNTLFGSDRDPQKRHSEAAA